MPTYAQEPVLQKFKASIEKKDFDSAEAILSSTNDIPKNILLYNKGFLSYAQGDLVEAKKYYEQARIHGMLSKEVSASLERVNQELAITTLESQYTTYENFLINYKLLPSGHLYLGFGFLVAMFLLSLIKKWHPLAVFMGSLIIIFGFYQYEIQKYELVYVKEDRLIQRGPSAIFEETGVLPAGSKVFLSKEKNDWRYIEYPEVLRGWVNNKREIPL